MIGKAIFIFYKNYYFQGIYHSMIAQKETNGITIQFCHTKKNRNIEMINFIVIPSPLRHEVTIQSFDSLRKRGLAVPNNWEYLLMKINKSSFSRKKKKKFMNCKEKKIYFIDLNKSFPKELKGKFNIIEIFYLPKQQPEIMEILGKFF